MKLLQKGGVLLWFVVVVVLAVFAMYVSTEAVECYLKIVKDSDIDLKYEMSIPSNY